MNDDRLNVTRELLGYLLVILCATAPWIVLTYFGPLRSILVAIAVSVIWRLLAGGLYSPRFVAAGCGWVIVVPSIAIAILVNTGLLIAQLFRFSS